MPNMLGPPLAATDLFEADVGDASQGVLHSVDPVLLPQRVLLGADDVDVMGDVVGRVVARLALTLTLEPRRDVLRRASVAWDQRLEVIGRILEREILILPANTAQLDLIY